MSSEVGLDDSDLLRAVLNGGRRLATPLGPTQFDALLGRAITHGVEPQLWWEAIHDRLPLDEAQRTTVIGRALPVIERSLGLEVVALEVITAVRSEGVEPLVLKGLAAAHLDRPQPWLRTFGDVDLLVKGEALETATRVLEQRGFRRRHPEPRAGFDARFAKGRELVNDQGVCIDLHRTLALGPLGLSVDLDELWHGTTTFTLAGTPVGALDRERRFLHACVHAVAGSAVPKWQTLLDLDALMRSGLALDVVVDLARSWRYQAVVVEGASMAAHLMGEPQPEVVAQLRHLLSPTRRERSLLSAYRSARLSSAGLAALGALELRGRERWEYGRALVWPGPEHRAATAGRWRRMGRDVTHMIRSSVTRRSR